MESGFNGIADVARFLTDERAAHETFARLRWPGGVCCPHCGHEKVYCTSGTNHVRPQWKCAGCRKKFSATKGTIFEHSHIPLGKWLYAIWKICSSKKGVSSKQLSRELRLVYKSAWFMTQRIRWAMTQEPMVGMLGGAGSAVEVDETYVGGKRPGKRGRGAAGKTIVVALMDRDSGRVRATSVPDIRGQTLKDVIRKNVAGESIIMTDSLSSYKGLDEEFAAHGTVDHNDEYVRGIVHTNFAESFFSLFKRGVMGTFHSLSEKHMDRYLNEFSFRWTHRELQDGAIMIKVIRSAEGMRLSYKPLKSNAVVARTSAVHDGGVVGEGEL